MTNQCGYLLTSLRTWVYHGTRTTHQLLRIPISFYTAMDELDGTQLQVLKSLRRELFDEGILHDGDTIGTDDETLLYVHDLPFSW